MTSDESRVSVVASRESCRVVLVPDLRRPPAPSGVWFGCLRLTDVTDWLCWCVLCLCSHLIL